MDKLCILVVDDEPGMLTGVERVLRDVKISLPDIQTEVCFEIKTAGSGEEALEIIKGSAPDILLLDHKLPGMHGLEVLDQIAHLKDNMLTIMITAYASLETAVTAIKRGAFDFLAKPFTPNEVKATVHKAVESLVHARQARKLAQEKRQVRFQFISVLAHELKSPLAAVEGYLDIMRNRSLGDDQAAYDMILDRSYVRLEGMRKLILDLLDMTRIESGKKQRELATVDITEIVDKSIETIQPQAESRNIAIEVQADRPIEIYGDRSEFEIILNNLISNAVKYNKDEGKVTISLAMKNDTLKIDVADTGIGLTEEEKSRLFQDFVRIKNAATRNILGSGLGLSIIKKLAYLYDGDVSVKSESGVGSTFTVTLKNQPKQDEADGVESN